MSALPTPWTLGVRRHAGSVKDAHGNTTSVFAEPIAWPVHGVAPGAMDEPFEARRDSSLVLWTVYAPKSSATPTERDRVIFDGVEYAVNGRPKDWTRGPWPNPAAGIVVELRNVEG